MAIMIPLKFNDTEIGTDEHGYIPRREDEDPDDEDLRYQRYMRKKTGDNTWRVYDCVLYKG